MNKLIGSFSNSLQTFFTLSVFYGTIYFSVVFFTTLFHLPTAEAFDRKAEEASSLIDLSKLITRVFDTKELADTITSVTTKVCNSEAAWLVLQDDEIHLRSVTNIGYIEAENITKQILTDELRKADYVSVIDKIVYRFEVRNDIHTVSYNSVAVAPLKIHDSIMGFLFVARKENYSFDEEDQKAIGAFADYAAIAFENATLIKKSIEKERLEKELDVAREIQYKIVPSETPQFNNLEIAFNFIPAFEVGGDYYDFFKVSENKMGFVIADVSGKGISAAFVMAEIKGIFESLAKMLKSPKELLCKANEILERSIDKKSFVTAIYGIIDTDTGKLVFSRAGHTQLLKYNGVDIESFSPNGMGLGLDYSSKFENSIDELEIQLNNNDIIILFTDGVTESQDENFNLFGLKRLKKIITNNTDKNLSVLSGEILQNISRFTENSYQYDDITLLLIKWKN